MNMVFGVWGLKLKQLKELINFVIFHEKCNKIDFYVHVHV